MEKLSIYTGKLNYNDTEFNFVFETNILRLIPSNVINPKQKLCFTKYIENNAYTFGAKIYINSVLKGISNETCNEIIFFPKSSQFNIYNSVLLVDIEFFIVKEYDRDGISSIGITGPEIDHIFPTSKALNIKFNGNGTWEVSTNRFSLTTSNVQRFNVDEKEINVYFGISRTYNSKIGIPPISLESIIYFEFEKTYDYNFIKKLILIAKQFIQYLCYRKNISFRNIIIGTFNSNGQYESFAMMYNLCDNSSAELYPLERGMYIKLELLEGCEGKILEDISNGNLYLRHLPNSYEDSMQIDASSFILCTSAFEWEFKRNYINGISKKEATITAEINVKNMIDKLIDENKGKSKSILKFLKGVISVDSLSSEIIQYGKDYKDISDIFGKYLYNLNDTELKYDEIGNRLSKQRNAFAHGDIDKDFIGLSSLDIIYLEQIVYIIQLSYYGLSSISIKNAINDLFGYNLIIN